MDELVWGAIWLYKATNDYYYLEQAEVLFEEANFYSPRVFSWDDKRAGVLVRFLFYFFKKNFFFFTIFFHFNLRILR